MDIFTSTPQISSITSWKRRCPCIIQTKNVWIINIQFHNMPERNFGHFDHTPIQLLAYDVIKCQLLTEMLKLLFTILVYWFFVYFQINVFADFQFFPIHRWIFKRKINKKKEEKTRRLRKKVRLKKKERKHTFN